MPRSLVTLEFDGNPVGEESRFRRTVRDVRTSNPCPNQGAPEGCERFDSTIEVGTSSQGACGIAAMSYCPRRDCMEYLVNLALEIDGAATRLYTPVTSSLE
jgi:hypothetical protein